MRKEKCDVLSAVAAAHVRVTFAQKAKFQRKLTHQDQMENHLKERRECSRHPLLLSGLLDLDVLFCTRP